MNELISQNLYEMSERVAMMIEVVSDICYNFDTSKELHELLECI